MKKTEIMREIRGFSSALIFTHGNPDGDTLGSAAALREGLISLGVKADVICPSAIPEKYLVYPGIDGFLTELPQKKYGAHIAVDCSTEGMLGHLSALFFSNKNTFNIDHHTSNSRYAKHNLVECVSSCAENIYELLVSSGVEITGDMAKALGLGIVTDTRCFSSQSVGARTLEIAASLVKKGASVYDINNAMFMDKPLEKARLFGRVLQRMKLYHGGKMAMVTTMLDDLSATGASPELTQGFVDYPLTIAGVEVVVSILQAKDKHFKISFRSKGSINVNEIAGTFGGGGHQAASGCAISGYYEDVVDKLVYVVGTYL